MKKLLIVSLAAMAVGIGGCASSKVKEAAVAFGTLTSEAATVQAEILKKERENSLKAIQNFYAQNNTLLQPTDSCTQLLLVAPSADDIKKCQLVPVPNQAQAPAVTEYVRLPALAQAIANYGTNLALLAGDFTEDGTKLQVALTSIASSAIELEGLTLAEGQEAQISKVRTDAGVAFATQVAIFATQTARDQALVKLIQDTDGAVETATNLLSTSMNALHTKKKAAAQLAFNQQRKAHRDAVLSKANEKKQSAVNAELEKKLQALKDLAAQKDLYAGIQAAHKALVKGTESNFSKKDIELFADRIIELYKSLEAYRDTFKEEGA